MAGCSKGESQPQQQASGTASAAVDVENPHVTITISTKGPMKLSGAPLEVTVLEDGKALTDGAVSVELRMPPSAAMGEMRTGTELKPAGEGHFAGQVDLMMAGKWNAIVRVKRGGQVIATHIEPVTAAE
jgi:hypothetical protein